MRYLHLHRSSLVLIGLAVLGLAACEFNGPVEDTYEFTTPLGGGKIAVKRPGGPMFATITSAVGGCLWFTNAANPLECIGECIEVPAGGGAYRIPGAADVWHFSDNCEDCPCEEEEPEEIGPDPKAPPSTYVHAQHAFSFGRFITHVDDTEVWQTTVLAATPIQSQRAYERLRDRLEAEHVSDVHQYVEVRNISRDRRDWRIWVRDDNQRITDVRVTLQGEEVGATTYHDGPWGYGSETAINLSVSQIRQLIGATLNLRVEWRQGGSPRSATYRATLQ